MPFGQGAGVAGPCSGFLVMSKVPRKANLLFRGLMYTGHLQFCDLAMRTLINMSFYFIVLYFAESSLFLPFYPPGEKRMLPNFETIPQQTAHRESTRGIRASLSFHSGFFPLLTVWRSELPHHQPGVASPLRDSCSPSVK